MKALHEIPQARPEPSPIWTGWDDPVFEMYLARDVAVAGNRRWIVTYTNPIAPEIGRIQIRGFGNGNAPE